MASGALKGLRVEGTEFVRSQLKDFLPKEAKSILRRSVATIAANLKKEMRKRASKDRGTLRKAIISKRQRGTKNSVEAAVWITHGSGARHSARYWHIVAFGSETRNPDDFITPVVEAARRTMPRLLEDQMFKQIAKQLELRAKKQKKALRA